MYTKEKHIGDIRVQVVEDDDGACTVSVHHRKTDSSGEEGYLLLEELELDSYEQAMDEYNMLTNLLGKIAALHNFV